MTLLHRTLRLLFCALIVSSTLAACGGGGGASSALPSTAGTQSSNPSATPTNAPGANSTPATSPGPVATPATGNYYVATTGNDSNSGTLSAPFKTLQHAANVATAGQTVIVENGTYQATSGELVNLTTSGTAGNPITFAAQNPLGAVLDGDNQAALIGFDFASNVGYINIEGFVIQNFQSGAIYLNGGSNGMSFANHNVIIENTHMTHNGFVCVLGAEGTRNVSVFNNEIDHCGSAASSPLGSTDHGLYIGGGNYTITGNYFHDNDYGWDLQLRGFAGDLNAGYDIENNTFGTHANVGGNSNPGNIVIYAAAGNSPSGTLQNNTFGSNGGNPPLDCYPIAAVGSPTWTISGNTGYTSSITSCTGLVVQQ